MAEIHIQRKKQPIWPWILGALVLVGFLWFLVSRTGGQERADTPQVVTTTPIGNQQADMGPMTTEVREFVTFVKRGDMGLQHEYTSNGIRNLADAITALANKNNVLNDQLNEKRDHLHTLAEDIQRDPSSTQHANKISAAFASSADMMETLQSNQFPHLNDHVAQVREAAQAVEPETQTLNQKESIHTFFNRASEALQAMENASGREKESS